MATLVATADAVAGNVRIDVEQTQLRDLFTRVAASSWGNATTGQAWTASGGAAGDYSVNGTQGLHTVNTTNVARHTFATVAADADMQVQVQVTIPSLAATQPIQTSVMARLTNVSNYYFAEISLAPTTNIATLSLRKNVLGVLTTISSVDLGQVHAAGATWNIVLSVCGKVLSAKAWRSTVTEPGWLLTANDGDLISGTGAGVRSFLVTGNTNGTLAFTYDNLVVSIGQPVRVWRVLPDASRTELRGSPLNTFPATAAAATAIATAYDNEGPFDVAYTYTLTSACGTVVEATSNSVTLSSGGNGWIRDPANPSSNIQLTEGATPYDECTTTREITFLGWDPRTFTNSSGIFDVINSERPMTVSMRRKRYESQFGFATKTLEDMDLMESIFMPGTVLVVALPALYGFGRPYNQDYITVLDLEQGQANTDDYRSPHRLWTVPFRLSYAPVDTNEGGTGSNGVGGGDATYADMTASAIGVTYAVTIATLLTYQQLAQGVGY